MTRSKPNLDSGPVLADAGNSVNPRSTPAQHDIDQLLPVFFDRDRRKESVGSMWLVLADLAIGKPIEMELADGSRLDARNLSGPCPSPYPQATTVLPAGSTLRYVGESFEMWGFGYLANIDLVMEVVHGPHAGTSSSLTEEALWLASGAVAMHTEAPALIVALEERPTDLSTAAADRRHALREIARTSRRPHAAFPEAVRP